MPYNSPTQPHREPEQKKPCHDSDTPGKKTIWSKKNAYCVILKTNAGTLRQCEEARVGARIAYEHRKCRFVRTEKNYRLFRNIELQYGVELTRSATDIETNVKTLVTENKTLADALTDLAATLKTAKAAFSDLRESSCKLDACSKDSCNRSQMAILTGQKLEDCDDHHKPDPGKRPNDCEHARDIFNQLVYEPPSLSKEIDTILNAASDVIGIQTFSNIASVSTQFLTSFKTTAKAFDDFIQDRMTKGATDLATAQTNLTQAIQTVTDADFALFNARIAVNCIKGVKDFLCHHKCECLCEGEHRLEKCKCEICEICQEVARIYYNESMEKQPAAVNQ